jgi:hypothetical protein
MSRSRVGVLVLRCAEVEYAVLCVLCSVVGFSASRWRVRGGEATRSGASRWHVIYGKPQRAAMRFRGGISRGLKCHKGPVPPGSLYDRLLMREILYETVRSGYIPPEKRPEVRHVRHLGLLLQDLRHHVMGGDNDPPISLHSTAIQAVGRARKPGICSGGGKICRYHQLVTDLRCKIDRPITRAGNA